MGRLGPARPGPLARAAIVGAYFLVFWVLLPAALAWGAAALDRALGWRAAGWAPGALPLAAGAGLLAWGILELWRGGGGLPVSALPPPRLTRRGPYRHCRHPIYLGFDLGVLGAGLLGGSPGLCLLAALLAPVWVAYARWEERGLLARFGEDYRRYQRQVGWLPRPGLYRLVQLAMALRALPARLEGRHHIPRRGPCVLVANHACYLDPCLVGALTWRPVHFTTTAEAYRPPGMRALVSRFVNVPVRRYRPDPRAAREVLRLLAEGEVVGVFAEGERSPAGDYQGAMADLAGVLARLPVPVIPVGLSGDYDVGPRWAGALRRRPVTVRAGPPILFQSEDPREDIDRALRALLLADPQPVHLEGLPRERLERVLWACPACGEERRWTPAALRCEACGAAWTGTPAGGLAGPDGELPFGALVRRLWARPEPGPLEVEAEGAVERDRWGPPRPLEPLGRATLRLDPGGLRWGALEIPLPAIRSVSTERADTLQVATAEGMWQFRLARGSVFRLHRALERWRLEARPPKPRPRSARRPALSSLARGSAP